MTSLTFDEAAFELLPKATEPLQRMRKQAFEEFRALPIPSQETEEWRYTDLSDFELSFEAHVPSVMRTTSGQDPGGLGIVFCDLDRAAEAHAELVERHLHTLVPTDRTKFTALHGAFRTHRARVGRDAEFRSLAIGFGASLARAEAETVLAGAGGFSEMLGVFFADGTQHFDHRSVQDHVAPNCSSDLLYKGALRDASRAVYSGWVHVRPGAQKTDAMQTSRNIVLSEHATADAIPNLEIAANDVRCGHAASVGPVDEETVFYLESRGISRAEAERLIVTGFFQEVLDRVRLDEVRHNAELAIQEELGEPATAGAR